MNLKNNIRKALKEATEKTKKYDYGCVMVDLNVNKDTWKDFQDMVEDDDIYHEEGSDGYGREMDPHVTILYGIHADVSDEDIKGLISKSKKPEIELKDVSSFENEGFDVLKFDIHSDDLVKLNKKFKELPHTSTYPDYHPHATICYLKPGLAKKYIKKFKEVDALETKTSKFMYSKPDGTKKNYPI